MLRRKSKKGMIRGATVTSELLIRSCEFSGCAGSGELARLAMLKITRFFEERDPPGGVPWPEDDAESQFEYDLTIKQLQKWQRHAPQPPKPQPRPTKRNLLQDFTIEALQDQDFIRGQDGGECASTPDRKDLTDLAERLLAPSPQPKRKRADAAPQQHGIELQIGPGKRSRTR